MNTTLAARFNKPLALLALGHMITDLSQGALPILLPFLQQKFGLTYTQIGLIVLIQNITSSVIQPIFGYITDKVSLPWLLPVSILLSGIGMSLTGLTGSYFTLLIAVVICGLGVAGFHPQGSRCANLVSNQAHKGRSMGIFSVGGNLGMAVGSIFMTLLLTFPGSFNNTMYFLVPGIITSVLFWLYKHEVFPQKNAWASTAAAQAITKQQTKPISLSLIFILLTFVFIRSTIHTGLSTYIPLYYINYLSGNPFYASYILSVFLLAGVGGTFTGAYISDKFGRKTVIVSSMLTSLPLIWLFPYTSGIVTLVLVALIGFILISSFATTIVLAQEMMPGYVGMASGLTIGFSIGLGGVGATILGHVADQFGIPVIFTILSVLPLVGALLALLFPGKITLPVFRRS